MNYIIEILNRVLEIVRYSINFKVALTFDSTNVLFLLMP